MKYVLNSLLAAVTDNYALYQTLSVVCIALSALCALFIIFVVMIQPGNSNGVGALGGNTDTFYGKNKSQTMESKLKKLTVVCLVVLIVLMIAFYLIQTLMVVG